MTADVSPTAASADIWTDVHRLLPEWLPQAKLGIFIHWGAYSLLLPPECEQHDRHHRDGSDGHQQPGEECGVNQSTALRSGRPDLFRARRPRLQFRTSTAAAG